MQDFKHQPVWQYFDRNDQDISITCHLVEPGESIVWEWLISTPQLDSLSDQVILSTSTPHPIDQTEGCQSGGWFGLEGPGIFKVQKIQSNMPYTLAGHCHFRNSEKSKVSSSLHHTVFRRSKITPKQENRIPPPTCLCKLLSRNHTDVSISRFKFVFSGNWFCEIPTKELWQHGTAQETAGRRCKNPAFLL